MLTAVMLSVDMLSDLMLNVDILSAFMLNVVMLSVVMLSVVAPRNYIFYHFLSPVPVATFKPSLL
jgi:hypothetical protein